MAITLYFTPTCTWSQSLKTWLKRRRIQFQEFDISENQNSAHRKAVLEKSGQIAVPVIEIGSRIIVGFHEERIQEALRNLSSST